MRSPGRPAGSVAGNLPGCAGIACCHPEPTEQPQPCLRNGEVHRLECDAIVNPTNEALNDPSPVPRAIVAAGGPELRAEMSQLQGCRTGEAHVTNGFDLPVL